MLLSVVILTRNRREELRRAIRSCLANRIDSMEIIVIDNASSDGTGEMIEKDFPEGRTGVTLKYYYQDHNEGVAAGRNIGFTKATGTYVFLLDDDAWIQSQNAFHRLIQRLESDVTIAAVSTAVFDKNRRTYQMCTCLRTLNDQVQILYYTGGSSLLRKDAFPSQTLYPSTLFYGSEEIYASLLVYSKGHRIVYDENILVIHEPSSRTRSSDADVLLNNIFNLFLVKYLQYPKGTRFLLYVGLLLRIFKYLGPDFRYIVKSQQLFNERYRQADIRTISFGAMVKIYKTFGLKAII